MKKSLFIVISLLTFLVTAKAQKTYNITGIVTDEKDVPIAGATVFLADSRKATSTDIDGKFNLNQVQPGKYTLVAKMLGYVVTTHDFILQKDTKFRFKLPEDNVMLNAVEITDMSLLERKKHLQTFITCFFGMSKNAAQCKILNTDDIKLKYNKKTKVLTASSYDFLIIENKALGYRLKYLLSNFTYDLGVLGRSSLSFNGTLFFEEMEGSKNQLKKWQEERAKAYIGSSTHFFRSLINNTLEEDGFVVFKMLNSDALHTYQVEQKVIPAQYFSPFNGLSGLVTDMDENFKIFNTGLLKKDSVDVFIVYTHEKEPLDFKQIGMGVKRIFSMPEGQLSLMQIVGDTVLISKTGVMTTLNSVWFTGYWTWGMVSAFLPSDYTIPAALVPKKKKLLSVPTGVKLIPRL